MANTTNFGWETPDDTDLVKDGAAAMRTLGNAIDTSLVDLKGGTTGQVLSKTSNTDMDFTWVTSDDANAIQNAIVDAKGDLISATAADTPARLASSGNNGDVLTVDTSTSTGLKWASPAAGGDTFAAGKNKIINGDFTINQRGFTSVTANGTYTFDRFVTNNSGGTVTFTPQTFTPGSAPVAGYEATNFLQIVTSGQSSTNYAGIGQKIENVRTFAGQTATLSFWAKATSGTPKIGWYAVQNFGSGGSATAAAYAGYTNNLSTSWARYSITYSVPSISGKTIGTSSAFENYLMVSDGSGTQGIQNNTFQIWGVQLEAGSNATDFQTATGTLAGELAACQRYYYRTGAGSNDPLAMGAFATSTICNGITTFPVTMRTRPTALEQSGTASDYRLLFNNTNATCSAVPTFEQASQTMARIRFDIASGGTAGGGATFASNASNGYLGWSAEL